MNTIRQELEDDVWRRHTIFAQQQAMKRYRVGRDLWPELNSRVPGDRWSAWKDRIFRFLWVALTLSLMLHARLAAAQSAEIPGVSGAVTPNFPASATAWLTQVLLSVGTLISATCLLWFCTPSRPGGSTCRQRLHLADGVTIIGRPKNG